MKIIVLLLSTMLCSCSLLFAEPKAAPGTDECLEQLDIMQLNVDKRVCKSLAGQEAVRDKFDEFLGDKLGVEI